MVDECKDNGMGHCRELEYLVSRQLRLLVLLPEGQKRSRPLVLIRFGFGK